MLCYIILCYIVSLSLSLPIYIYIYTHVHTHIYMYTYIHIHTYAIVLYDPWRSARPSGRRASRPSH